MDEMIQSYIRLVHNNGMVSSTEQLLFLIGVCMHLYGMGKVCTRAVTELKMHSLLIAAYEFLFLKNLDRDGIVFFGFYCRIFFHE